MFDHTQIPPEILATVFEIGILNWDIRFLPPLRLVCRAWKDIVDTTPRLWGIITIHKRSKRTLVESQIKKAQSSPLSVYAQNTTSHKKALSMLVNLSNNWVNAEVPIALLGRCRWADMRGSLETLVLSAYSSWLQGDHPEVFFDLEGTTLTGLPRLRSFTAIALSERWITPFLSPAITYFNLRMHPSYFNLHPSIQHPSLADTLKYISKVPQVSTLKLKGMHHGNYDIPSSIQIPIRLPNLITLKIHNVLYPSTLLSELSAPSLETLEIHRSSFVLHWDNRYRSGLRSLGPFFATWSHGVYLPSSLHTLVLKDCLEVPDVAFLIRWLGRLTSLKRLMLYDDAISRAAKLPPSEEETNIFRALASPEGAGLAIGGWLCPALTVLCLVTDSQVTDLIPVARARGGLPAGPCSPKNPEKLRYLEALLCPSGSEEEVQTLKSLAEEVVCTCLGCEFKLTI